MTITSKIELKVVLPSKHLSNCLRLAEGKDVIEKYERKGYFTCLEITVHVTF